jgi:hypothetical protein
MARPSFLARLWLAVLSSFRIVFDGEFAARVTALRAPAPPAFVPPKERPTLPAKPKAISAAQLARSEQALHLLSLLQREGRLIDFCEEELAGFSDAQVGAAARPVHDGCRKALREAFALEPVRREAEGAAVELPGGFDSRAIRLTGNVLGNPPFRGVLKHHGWRAAEVRMPGPSGDPTLLAPAEVELP